MIKPIYICIILIFASCNSKNTFTKNSDMTAEKLLGNPEYQAICYGGYRTKTREVQPTLAQLKEDMIILEAMNIKFIRTYNVHYDEVKNLLKVISDLKKERPGFEMYMMLGAWIDCKNAFTEYQPIHDQESDRNAIEIEEAVRLANQYPDIVKVLAVGNEAMVKWATSYFVTPDIILKWVNYLQDLKKENKLPKDLWITSSDNFASWGGGDTIYHVKELIELYHAVDYVSIHTYPMHDTHYNPVFWGVNEDDNQLTEKQKIDAAMLRAKIYAVSQYKSVHKYMTSLGINKPIHIGETGWATHSNEHYGDEGSHAADEYKSAIFYKGIKDWSDSVGITCFYFEAFDEQWKDAANPKGSENHFGLINLKSEAKYALWDLVDDGKFENMTRDGKPITKTFQGNIQSLMHQVKAPPSLHELNTHK
ncbi:MAG: glycosyl hydrolase family 17 [Saprospiraceae bacterium]|nr:glycosyl hydrolase family 17 [Saprospiraceae bacterium]